MNMRRAALLLVILTLVISLAAPSGAAFAISGNSDDEALVLPEGDEQEPGEDIEEEEELADNVLLPEIIPPAATQERVTPESKDTVVDDKKMEDVSLPQEESSETEPEQPPVLPPVLPMVVIAQIQVGAPSPSNASDEYVSIYNNGAETVDVTGWCLRNKSGKAFACLDENDTDYEMVPGSYIGFSNPPERVGEHGIVAPFKSGSNQIVAAGDTIQLVRGDEVIDVITWTSQPSSKPYAIERNWDMQVLGRLQAGSAGWSWQKSLAVYGRIMALIECGDGVMVLENEECPMPEKVNACSFLALSEIAANTDEQFIELRNTGVESASIAGCRVQTNRNTKSFVFPENTMLDAGAFVVVPISETELTVTKTTSGTVYVLSSDGRTEVDSVTYSNVSKNTSWAFVEGVWVQTYALTPASENVYLRYMPCEDGYARNADTGRCNRVVEELSLTDCGEGRERNPDTGRCRNIPVAKEVAPCKDGQYRSEETNRCRSIAVAAASVLKPCADDQFRNPLTNRCKKIASSDDVALADCGEGRERNPETNRCRNILASMPPDAAFAVEPIKDSVDVFVGWWALGGVLMAGAAYGAWEWREEVSQIIRNAVKTGRSQK